MRICKITIDNGNVIDQAYISVHVEVQRRECSVSRQAALLNVIADNVCRSY